MERLNDFTKDVPGPSAATITVEETLNLLNGEFRSVAQGVANGEYALWLGSGISRERVPGLPELICKVLTHLHEKSTDVEDCAYRQALGKAVSMAGLREDEKARTDLGVAPTDWPDLAVVVEGLVPRYSEFLSIEVPGEELDYLVWDGIDVRETFGTPADPDCEHLCIAILIMEGALEALVSANWDGLVEKAVARLTGETDGTLKIVVLPADLSGPEPQAVLMKVHGCAVRATDDPEKYRDAIIARRSQITEWPNKAELAAIRTRMKDLATRFRTLVVGLSVQDGNLQQLISKAAEELRHEWPSDPPTEVFADEELGLDQLNVLRLVYGEEVFATHGEAIRDGSLIRAFGKSFLTALVLFVLRAKLGAYLSRADIPHLVQADRDDLGQGLDHLVERLGGAAVADPLSFVCALVLTQSRALSLFRRGCPGPEDGRYVEVTRDRVARVSSDPEVTTNGLRELAAALALLGRGEHNKVWELAVSPTQSGSTGALKVVKDGEEAAVFFTANGAATVRLHKDGVADLEAPETVIVASTEPVETVVRSPRTAYGRSGEGRARQVHVRELLMSARDLESLEERFRQEAAL